MSAIQSAAQASKIRDKPRMDLKYCYREMYFMSPQGTQTLQRNTRTAQRGVPFRPPRGRG